MGGRWRGSEKWRVMIFAMLMSGMTGRRCTWDLGRISWHVNKVGVITQARRNFLIVSSFWFVFGTKQIQSENCIYALSLSDKKILIILVLRVLHAYLRNIKLMPEQEIVNPGHWELRDETEAKSVRGMCECEKNRFNLQVILGLSRSKKYRDDWNDQNDLLQGSIRPMMILTQNIWHWQKFMIAKNHHQWTKYGANIPCFMSLLKSDLHIFWLKIAAKRFQKIEADTALTWHWLHWTNSVLNSDCLGDRETGDDDLLIWSG